MTPNSPDLLLSIRGLRTYFDTEAGVAKAVDGIDLDIRAGEVLGLVGESGSGKSVTALSVLRLVPSPPGRIVAGEISSRDGTCFVSRGRRSGGSAAARSA
jgi:ABC-type dipeptide/oligopeptide/nickel transport system ATPase component